MAEEKARRLRVWALRFKVSWRVKLKSGFRALRAGDRPDDAIFKAFCAQNLITETNYTILDC